MLKLNPHGHRLLRTCKNTIYLDANVEVRAPLSELLEMLRPEDELGVFSIGRNWVDEGNWVVDNGFATSYAVERQLEKYRMDGFDVPTDPKAGGSLPTYYGKVVIRRMGEKRVEEFNKIWSKEFEDGVPRDQLSLPYAAWFSGVKFRHLGRAIFLDAAKKSHVYPPFSSFFRIYDHACTREQAAHGSCSPWWYGIM